MSSPFCRRGFSLVEVLVSLGIIGILFGMLVPAVQRVREATARLVCQNHMKHVAFAVLHYETSNKRLPPAGTGYGWCYVLNQPDGPNAQGLTGYYPSDPHIVNQNGLSLLLSYLGHETLEAKLAYQGLFFGGKSIWQ